MQPIMVLVLPSRLLSLTHNLFGMKSLWIAHMRRVYHCAFGRGGIPLAPARGEQTLGQAVGFRPFAAGIRQQFSEWGSGLGGMESGSVCERRREGLAVQSGLTGCPSRAAWFHVIGNPTVASLARCICVAGLRQDRLAGCVSRARPARAMAATAQ